jgi:hypothetical protein
MIGKDKGPMAKKYCYNKVSNEYFFGGKRRPRQEKTRKWSTLIFLFFLKTASFGHILKESTHSCFDAWLFLLVHIRFTPSEGPKGFAN